MDEAQKDCDCKFKLLGIHVIALIIGAGCDDVITNITDSLCRFMSCSIFIRAGNHAGQHHHPA